MHRQNIEAWQHGHAFGQDRVRADERISDLHVWSIGPGIHAAIVALVADDPKTPSRWKSSGARGMGHELVAGSTIP